MTRRSKSKANFSPATVPLLGTGERWEGRGENHRSMLPHYTVLPPAFSDTWGEARDLMTAFSFDLQAVA